VAPVSSKLQGAPHAFGEQGLEASYAVPTSTRSSQIALPEVANPDDVRASSPIGIRTPTFSKTSGLARPVIATFSTARRLTASCRKR